MRHVGGRYWVNSEVNIEVNSSKRVLNSVKTVSNLSKTGTKLSETVSNTVKSQSNGRVNLRNMYIRPGSVPEAGYTVCSDTPRFSYDGSKTAVQHVGTSGWYCGWDGCTGWVYRVGTGGWVYRVGTGGAIPGYYPAIGKRRQSQRSGPVGPCRGPEWWGLLQRAPEP